MEKSWPELILTNKYHTNSNDGETPEEKAVNYGVAVLQSSSHGVEIPKRQYIWYGGKYPNDHATKAGEEWCFEYGEKEWVDPEFTITDRAGKTRKAGFSDYKNRAKSDIEKYEVGCD